MAWAREDYSKKPLDQGAHVNEASFVITNKRENLVNMKIDEKPLLFVIIRKVVAFFPSELFDNLLILFFLCLCEEQPFANVFFSGFHEKKSSARVGLKIGMGEAVQHDEGNILIINNMGP
jgi:hypothetical protein